MSETNNMTNHEMTVDEAKTILSNFGLFSREDILKAVKCMQQNDAQSDVLADFFKSFRKSNGSKFDGDYDLTYDILRQDANNNQDLLKVTQGKAAELSKANLQKLSISDLDTMAAVMRAANKDSSEEWKNTCTSYLRQINNEIYIRANGYHQSGELVPDEDMDILEHYISRTDPDLVNSRPAPDYLPLVDIASQLNSQYDIDNGLNKTTEVLDTYNNQEFGKINDDDEEFKQFLDRIVIEDEKSEEPQDEKKKNDIIGLLKDAAIIRAQQKRLQDPEVKAEDEFKLIVAEAYVAGSMEEIPSSETICDAKKWKEYLDRLHEEAKKRLDNFGKDKDKITLKVKDIITAVAVTNSEAEKFSRKLSRKLKGVQTKIGEKANQLGQKAKSLWGNRHQITKAVADNLSDRKWQFISNTTLAVGTSALVATPIGSAAVIGYAAYSVAGNYVWPIVAEARKMKRLAEEKGQPPAPWKERWKQAKETMKKSKSYQTRCNWGWVAGIATAGLGVASMGLVNGAVAGQISAKAAKVLGGAARAASTSLASITTNINTKKDYKEGKVDKASLNAARVSTAVSVLGAGLASYLGMSRIGAMNTSDLANTMQSGFGGNNLTDGNGGSGMGTGYTTPQTGAYTPDSTAADSLRYYMGQGQDSVAPGNDSSVSGSGSDSDYNGGDQQVVESFDPSELRGNEVHMYNVINRKWPDGTIASYLSSIQGNEFVLANGAHYSLPDGVSKMQALFAYQRLDEWTRGVNNEEIRTNVRILGALFRVKDCDDIDNFTPAQIKKAISIIPSVKTETGVRDVMIEGCPCPQKGYVFGTIDYDKLNSALGTNLKPKIDPETGLPILKGVRAPRWNFNDPCDPKPHFEKVAVNCDCEEKEVPHVNEPKEQEAPRAVEKGPKKLPGVSIPEDRSALKGADVKGEPVTIHSTKSTDDYHTDTSKVKLDSDKNPVKHVSYKKNDDGERIEMVSGPYDGAVDNGNGYAQENSGRFNRRFTMTREAYDRAITNTDPNNNPFFVEQSSHPLSDTEYSQLNNPDTNVVYKGEVEHDGSNSSRYETSLTDMEVAYLNSAVDIDPSQGLTLTQDGNNYVITMKDTDGSTVTLKFDTEGHGSITNAKGEAVLMIPADREALAQLAHEKVLADANVDVKFNFGAQPGTPTERLDDLRNNPVSQEEVNTNYTMMKSNLKVVPSQSGVQNVDIVSMARNRGGNTI